MTVSDGVEARREALMGLVRIDRDDAYANLVVRSILDKSPLDERDRRLVTELINGTTRMRRALDELIEPHLMSPPPVVARNALRMGAYQLEFTRVPPHAAVSATVGATPKRFRGLVNAVLRKISTGTATWSNAAAQMSYPDWIVTQLEVDLGADRAKAALESMNQPARRVIRDDGYSQDLASQWVVDAPPVEAGQLVADVCAAPGGKATGFAGRGARVIALDHTLTRTGLISQNAADLGLANSIAVSVGDATVLPIRPQSVDHVVVDAPCSGLGVLRRRSDARWRGQPEDVERLVTLQMSMLEAARLAVKPGGVLTYSVCTLTAAETTGVAAAFEARHPELTPLPRPDEPWEEWGSGSILLPSVADTDGMCLFMWRIPSQHD
jgi:16S rRNA (cytosine967-C5)-methyltransferase